MRSRIVTRSGLASALALGALAAAGCGTSETKVVATSTVRPVIEKQIRSSGLPPAKAIDCPQTKPEAGKTFTCHVTMPDGSAYAMTIRIDKVGAKRPLLTVVRSLPLTLGASNVKPLIYQQIRSTGAPAAKSISCQNVAATVHDTFTCKVTLADGHVLTDAFRVLKISDTEAPSFAIKALGIR